MPNVIKPGSTGGAELLNDLQDVNAPAPAGGDFIRWNATDGEWQNIPSTSPRVIDDLLDVDTSTTLPNVNETLIWDGTNWVPGASSASRGFSSLQTPNPAMPQLVVPGERLRIAQLRGATSGTVHIGYFVVNGNEFSLTCHFTAEGSPLGGPDDNIRVVQGRLNFGSIQIVNDGGFKWLELVADINVDFSGQLDKVFDVTTVSASGTGLLAAPLGGAAPIAPVLATTGTVTYVTPAEYIPPLAQADRVFEVINQAAHGFGPGTPVYKDAGGIWREAQANDAATVTDAIVGNPIDNDNFEAVYYGIVDYGGPTGLTIAQTYFLDDANPGAVITPAPATIGSYQQAVLEALDTNRIKVLDQAVTQVIDDTVATQNAVFASATGYTSMSGNTGGQRINLAQDAMEIFDPLNGGFFARQGSDFSIQNGIFLITVTLNLNNTVGQPLTLQANGTTITTLPTGTYNSTDANFSQFTVQCIHRVTSGYRKVELFTSNAAGIVARNVQTQAIRIGDL